MRLFRRAARDTTIRAAHFVPCILTGGCSLRSWNLLVISRPFIHRMIFCAGAWGYGGHRALRQIRFCRRWARFARTEWNITCVSGYVRCAGYGTGRTLLGCQTRTVQGAVMRISLSACDARCELSTQAHEPALPTWRGTVAVAPLCLAPACFLFSACANSKPACCFINRVNNNHAVSFHLQVCVEHLEQDGYVSIGIQMERLVRCVACILHGNFRVPVCRSAPC